jgi:hypothetical protein
MPWPRKWRRPSGSGRGTRSLMLGASRPRPLPQPGRRGDRRTGSLWLAARSEAPTRLVAWEGCLPPRLGGPSRSRRLKVSRPDRPPALPRLGRLRRPRGVRRRRARAPADDRRAPLGDGAGRCARRPVPHDLDGRSDRDRRHRGRRRHVGDLEAMPAVRARLPRDPARGRGAERGPRGADRPAAPSRPRGRGGARLVPQRPHLPGHARAGPVSPHAASTGRTSR